MGVLTIGRHPGEICEEVLVKRKCIKDPTEIFKIVLRANETFSAFEERWTDETSYIQDILEVMRISAFMSNSKCPELATLFLDQVPRMVMEMMKRRRSQEARPRPGLESLTKFPKEILATEHRLRFPPCPSLVRTQAKKETRDGIGVREAEPYVEGYETERKPQRKPAGKSCQASRVKP
ncbi:hypothetical protein Tco_1296270 [Tanacetum coccineum]